MSTALMAGDIIQFRVVTKDETGGECFNIFNFGINNPVVGTVTDLAAVEIMDGILAPLYKALMAPSSTYDGIEGSIVNRSPKPASVFYNGSTGPGLVGSKNLAGQTAGIISWTTAFAGRAFRGRSYIPNLADGWKLATGIPSSFFQTAMLALGAAIITQSAFTDLGASAPCVLILFHRRTLGFNLILGLHVPLKFATQRRRGNYGKNRIPPI